MTTLIKLLINGLLTAGRHVIAALLTKKMLLWALNRYAQSTQNTVDDYAVQLICGGLNNDQRAIELAVEGLADVWLGKPQRAEVAHE